MQTSNATPQPLPRPFAMPSPQRESTAMLGDSRAIRHLRTQLQRIGPYFRRVLLTGESGSGKELAARLLHRHTPNASGPFVCCDAATASSALLEPASAARITPVRGGDPDCLLSAAQGGTLYLAGVCDMPLPAQEKLLHVLQRYERRRRSAMGANPPETRVVASSRRDLRALASTGQFRQDLYHHLAMVEIPVPSLRDRRDDLAPLAAHFLTASAAQCQRAVPGLSDDALQRLWRYGWPGNLRELENILSGAMLAADGSVIEVHHLPALAGSRAESLRDSLAKTVRLQDVIDQHVVQVLEQCDGNKVRAAELLGISRSTLYRMLETGLPSIS